MHGRLSIGAQKDPDGWGSGASELIAAEASGRFDRLEFVEIEFVDGLQGLSGGAVLKVVGQSLEPGAIFGLEGDEDSNGIAPAAERGCGGQPLADSGSPAGRWRERRGAGPVAQQ